MKLYVRTPAGVGLGHVRTEPRLSNVIPHVKLL